MDPRAAAAFRPHDLLWLAGRRALHADEALPAWATPAWLACAPVVVRRDHMDSAGGIPVGLRGKTRSQRFAAYLASDAVVRSASPEALAQDAAWNREMACEAIPAMAVLTRIAPLLDAAALVWGPTGSVGFALASGLPVLRANSDLDLLIRSDVPPTPPQLRQLLALTFEQDCRIDIQIDTGHGGFAFAEWVANWNKHDSRVLLKTANGPCLVRDPWSHLGSAWHPATQQAA